MIKSLKSGRPTGLQQENDAQVRTTVEQMLKREKSEDYVAMYKGFSNQLDELIKDKDKVLLLGERMDPLLVSCYMQYRNVLYNKLRTDNANPKEVLKLFQASSILTNL